MASPLAQTKFQGYFLYIPGQNNPRSFWWFIYWFYRTGTGAGAADILPSPV